MRLEVLDVQGTDKVDLYSASADWWSTHVEPDWGIELGPGDKVGIKTGVLCLICGAEVAVLTGPAMLECKTKGEQWSVWKFIKGEIVYIGSSGAVKFLTEFLVLGLLGMAAKRRYWAWKNRGMGASATPVIYASEPDRGAQTAGQAQHSAEAPR